MCSQKIEENNKPIIWSFCPGFLPCLQIILGRLLALRSSLLANKIIEVVSKCIVRVADIPGVLDSLNLLHYGVCSCQKTLAMSYFKRGVGRRYPAVASAFVAGSHLGYPTYSQTPSVVAVGLIDRTSLLHLAVAVVAVDQKTHRSVAVAGAAVRKDFLAVAAEVADQIILQIAGVAAGSAQIIPQFAEAVAGSTVRIILHSVAVEAGQTNYRSVAAEAVVAEAVVGSTVRIVLHPAVAEAVAEAVVAEAVVAEAVVAVQTVLQMAVAAQIDPLSLAAPYSTQTDRRPVAVDRIETWSRVEFERRIWCRAQLALRD